MFPDNISPPLGADADAEHTSLEGDLAPVENRDAQTALNSEVGYGFGVDAGLFTGTPYSGLGLSESGRDRRLSWQLASVRRDGQSASADVNRDQDDSATGNRDARI